MPIPDRPPNYRRPQPSAELPGQQPLAFAANTPDPKAEARAKAAIYGRLDRFERQATRHIEGIRMARILLERGIQLPDLAQALGSSPGCRAPPGRQSPGGFVPAPTWT